MDFINGLDNILSNSYIHNIFYSSYTLPNNILIFGLVPVYPWHLIFPVLILILWLITWPIAKLKQVVIFHNSNLSAAIIEEIIFRGAVLGILLYFTHDKIQSLAYSSLIFGFAHMRNIWWAGWGKSFKMSIYNSFITGPIFGAICLITGDIYIGMFVHYIYNMSIILSPARQNQVPTDSQLKEKMARFKI